MTTHNFIKLQVFALLFAAIISPLSAVAGTNSKQATIEFALGTYEVPGPKAECAPFSYYGGTITGVGTGSITVKGKRERLGVLSLTANDCIAQLDASHFTAKGNLTLSAGKNNTITALYSTDFSQTEDPNDDPLIFEYQNFKLTITGGTGRFKGVSGLGDADGMSHIGTGLGFVEGIINISN
ncbi:hypothetical protein [Candidatus Nitrotoga arctica]|uniref:Secreted protein n=1 Tax=Candidatus Nitrotoga arctica TaxID=453162 RepID=A0ABM8YZ34_9PROT|nr:hypothetical protein [Candidatus Nitrotoga arctica]CAG9932823.1 conserved exported protein of unknown function [Candidatus Nitrotoga arctica]